MTKELQPGIGIGVAIIHNGKVLMGRRTRNEKLSSFTSSDKWTFAGGKCQKWQTLQENVAREVFEETGLEIRSERLEVISILDLMQKDRDSHFVTVGFKYEFLNSETPQPKVMEPDEIDRWEWFDIGRGLLPADQIYAPTEQMIQSIGWR